MHVRALDLPGVFLFEPVKHGDHRGFFSETFRHSVFAEHVPGVDLVQDNHSLSAEAGTLRGLHFQTPPHVQGKLVRCPRGRIVDVIVDIRRGSPTYGQHLAVELSAENWLQLWVPAGFAHGFCTLEANSEVSYKVSDYYCANCDGGIAFADPALGIDWPYPISDLRVSDKDKSLPKLADLDNPFTFDTKGAAA